MSDVTITTNNVPRDLINEFELTAEERKEFDYHDWDKIERGEESAEFFRYKGQLYDLGEFSSTWGMSNDSGLPDWMKGWHGYTSDSFSSGMLVKFPKMFEWSNDDELDYERVIVGRFYVS
jgi:hypothetical protein